jgi:hypothetical protein
MILKILANEKYREKFALKSKKLIKKFDWTNIADNLEGIIFSVIREQ